jgi:predicted  nucleic acid-binding Zn-ribbon protein
VKITEQLEVVHQKNKKLTSALRQANADNEGLKQRLGIALRANTELSQKFSDEQSGSSKQRQTDHEQFHEELQKAKAQAKTQVDSLFSELRSAQETKDQLELQSKLASNKVESLLHNAELYFSTSFSDIDALIDHLGQSEVASPQYAPVSLNDPKASVPSANATPPNKKVSALRSRLKSANAEVEDLSTQLAKSQREKAEIEKHLVQEIEELKSRYALEAEEQALSTADLNHQIKGLQYKVDSLTDNWQSVSAQSRWLLQRRSPQLRRRERLP